MLIGSAFVGALPDAIHTMYQPQRASAGAAAQARTQPHQATRSTIPPPLPAREAASLTWNPLAFVVAGADEAADWQQPLSKFKVEHADNVGAVAATNKEHTHAAAVATTEVDATTTTTTTTEQPASDHSHEGHTHEGRRLLETDESHSHAHSHAATTTTTPSSTPAHSTPSASSPSSSSSSSSRFVDVQVGIGSHSAGGSAAGRRPRVHSLGVSSGVAAKAVPVVATSSFEAPTPLIVCFGEDHASKMMGALLALGFVAMLLVDRCAGQYNTNTCVANERVNENDRSLMHFVSLCSFCSQVAARHLTLALPPPTSRVSSRLWPRRAPRAARAKEGWSS